MFIKNKDIKMLQVKMQVCIPKLSLRKKTQKQKHNLFDQIICNDKPFLFNSDHKPKLNTEIYKRNLYKNTSESKKNLTAIHFTISSPSKKEFCPILPKINQLNNNEHQRHFGSKSKDKFNLLKSKIIDNPKFRLTNPSKFYTSNKKKKNNLLRGLLVNDETNKIKKKLFLLKTEEHKNNEDFFIPENKIILNYFSLNNYASFTQKGYISFNLEKPENQDVTLIMENIYGIKNFNIYGVMDGHGSNGHFVSKFIKSKIENFFSDKLNLIKKKSKNNFISDINYIKKKLTNNNYKIIRNIYKNINEELSFQEFDVHFSGSTFLLLFKLENLLICSNTGDSKAIMIKNFNTAIELNIEHKPTNIIEKSRIENFGGVISQCNDMYDDGLHGGPYRVWKKGCDYPGLSLSRSMGDIISKELGVICEPDILSFEISKECNYLVLGSDGVWEYLNNENVIDIVNMFNKNNDLEKICKCIIEKSTELYMKKEHRVDDISVSIICLDNKN